MARIFDFVVVVVDLNRRKWNFNYELTVLNMAFFRVFFFLLLGESHVTRFVLSASATLSNQCLNIPIAMR